MSAEGNHHALVPSSRGDEVAQPVSLPMGTQTTRDRFGMADIPLSLYVDDAGFRMLEPHEIKAGMGFATDYLLLGSKRDKVKQAGNAVTPPAARDLGYAVAEFLNGVAA